MEAKVSGNPIDVRGLDLTISTAYEFSYDGETGIAK